MMKRLVLDAKEWCRGRSWVIRLPVVLFFVYIFVRHLGDASYRSVFDATNFGVHELGHAIFAPFGELVSVAGGSIFECLAPVILMIGFLRQRDFFAISFAFGWLSTALFDVARYVADARSMQMELVSPWSFGDEPIIHDWNYLLSKFNMLQYDGALAFALRCAAAVSMLVCVIGGSWLLYQMMRRR